MQFVLQLQAFRGHRGLLPGVILPMVLSCSGSRTHDGPPPIVGPSTVYVSPDGDDSAAGTAAAPLRTLGHALEVETAERIVVASGRYVEPEVIIARPVTIACPSEAPAVLEGTLVFHGRDATVARLDIQGGVRLEGAEQVSLLGGTISAGSLADTIRAQGARARLEDLVIACGLETCLSVEGSTLSITRTQIKGEPVSKRGLRVETSSVTLREVVGSGTNIGLIQAGTGGRLRIVGAQLSGFTGTALTGINGARIEAERVTIGEVRQSGVILSLADARFTGLTIGPVVTAGVGIGVQGSYVEVRGLDLTSGGQSGVIVNNHRERSAAVTIDGGVIRHGATLGVNLGQGRLVLKNLRFEGDPTAAQDGEDAILAAGELAELEAEALTIDGPAGFGIGIYTNALAQVNAVITRPRIGGINVEDTAGESIRLHGLKVSGCKTGSGVVAQNAVGIVLEDSEISGCIEAGLLAGDRSRLAVRNSRFLDNRQYGVAAFGGTEIQISGSSARGSKWAIFATCADGSGVIDEGGNQFVGPTTMCP